MYGLNVRIAEHIVSFSTDSISMFEYIRSQFWNVRIEEQLLIQSDLAVHILDSYGESFVDYQVDVISDEQKIIYKRSDYYIEVDCNHRTGCIRAYDDFALKHALLNLYSAFITHHQWGLLLHSSCVIHKNEAYVFAGQSGAGKSTVAKLSIPREILSDEATIVKVHNNEIIVFNSPFRSEIGISYYGSQYPLAAIQMLRQSQENKRTRFKKIDGIMQLLNIVFYWTYNPAETGKVLEMCRQLVELVPVFALYFQKNDAFWEEIDHETAQLT